uniref:Transmembrane 9 superfamily member n=1 Tax=Cannabis sativa TaxID=3483 RepID=A0A803R2N4_CANSA
MADSATIHSKPLLRNLLQVQFLLKKTFLIIILIAHSASSLPNNHRYNVGDSVPFFVNKLGPLNNPSETYQYYDLPFCHPDPIIRKKETIGEVLNGDRLTNSLYELNFREEKIHKTLCHKKLKVAEIAKFRDAVIRDFYFQMYYDDLPLWAYVGKVEENWNIEQNTTKYYIFTHVQFDAVYNDNQVIEIQAFSDPNHVLDITEDVEIDDVEFTYSVNWNVTSVKFDNRMNRYSKASLSPIVRKYIGFLLLIQLSSFFS